MEFKPVKSSLIDAIGYCPVAKELRVKFKNGKTYHYADVPPHVHAGLCSADSIGKHFGANVRKQFKHTLGKD